MKTWREAEDIFEEAIRLIDSGKDVALATVVNIVGSTYRRPGARLLIGSENDMIGNVSGGCLEQDVREVARRVLKSGTAEVVHYDTGKDEDILWGMGMGCEGELDIFVQPFPVKGDEDIMRKVASHLRGDAPFALSTVLSGPGCGRMVLVAGGRLEAGTSEDAGYDKEILDRSITLLDESRFEVYELGPRSVFTDVLQVPPHVILFGAGDDAMPLCACAAEMGFRVTIVDHRPASLTKERFPDAFKLVRARPEDGLADVSTGSNSYVVVKTRGLVFDQAWSAALAETEVPYIGLLGPRSRREKILQGIDEKSRHRFYGPVGLDLGADGPQQVALSIVAEILTVAARRQPGHLRERKTAIHG